jgi:hypothetical protein
LAELFEGANYAQIGAVVLQVDLVGHNNADQVVLQRVAVDENLSQELTSRIDVLDLLRRNVLTLKKIRFRVKVTVNC